MALTEETVADISREIKDMIALHPPKQAEVLTQLRELIGELVPAATERISYGMPTFEISGQILIYFQGFKDHNSLFLGPEVGVRLAKELGDMVASKGTIKFEKEKLLSKSLLRLILKTRITIINESFPKKNGDYLSFYDNGHLKSKGKYKDSMMHGYWHFYRKDGSLMREGKLNMGEPEGEWITHARP